MNPCTLGWYLPLLVKDLPGALQPSERNGSSEGEEVQSRGEKGMGYGWQELDSKFRRDLPDDVYVGRLAYRGLIMRACPRIGMLDGVEVTEKERTKADQLLQGMMAKHKIKGVKGKSGTTTGIISVSGTK
jgi:DNA-binding LacI/PurR family transcriptional regulator